MWKRSAVIDAHMSGNGGSRSAAKLLLREFADGNTIANEGCLITCLAMVLHSLDMTPRRHAWTPKSVNESARKGLWYSDAGLSMVPLYADLVSELSCGEVQLCAKEEYLSGEAGWDPTFASKSWLVRGYGGMSNTARRNFMVMLKTGTYDDSVASHYVLLNPALPSGIDDDDPEVLDPAMPAGKQPSWRISDSAKEICKDVAISRAWVTAGIGEKQICGVWLFGRWRSKEDRLLMEPFVKSLARQL